MAKKVKTTRRTAEQHAITSIAARDDVYELDLNFSTETGAKKKGLIEWYKKVRKMRRHPTIAIVRNLYLASIMSGHWSYESERDAPPELVDFITTEISKIRFKLLKTASLAAADFGWAPFEKVLKLNKNKQLVISQIKPLLHDITAILVKPNGDFYGFRQTPVSMMNEEAKLEGTGEVILDPDEALIVYMDVEAQDWYGNGLMQNCERDYDRYEAANRGADRFDAKVAGAHWVVWYPPGRSLYNGTELDNQDIAKRILNDLEASGMMAVPTVVAEYIDEINKDSPLRWKVELLESGSSGGSFGARMQQLDVQLVRGWHFTERSILEGEHGTKAEAAEHGSFSLKGVELKHDEFVECINTYLTNHLIRVNWGEEYQDTVWVQAGDIEDQNRIFLRALYDKILANPQTFIEEIDELDVKSIREQLGLPVREKLPPTDDPAYEALSTKELIVKALKGDL